MEEEEQEEEEEERKKTIKNAEISWCNLLGLNDAADLIWWNLTVWTVFTQTDSWEMQIPERHRRKASHIFKIKEM